MNKKLYLPLIIFLGLAMAFLVQLQRNSQGDDPKTLESALVGKPVPAKTLPDLLSEKTYDESLFKQGKPVYSMYGRPGVLLVMPNTNI